MKQRKEPIRMCAGCREGRPKKELVRVVRSPEGEISVDLTGKKSGRGAYICRDAECLKKARKSRSLERALECAVSEEIYLRLEREIEGAAANG
ncbi:MAG: YlxR family protein [Oscillospiraceae bacterium]|nr:YlxR family protein [Oscillospiraceae bacterium]